MRLADTIIGVPLHGDESYLVKQRAKCLADKLETLDTSELPGLYRLERLRITVENAHPDVTQALVYPNESHCGNLLAMVTITLHQSTAIDDPNYTATHEITEAVGIGKNLFVFRTSDGMFMNVATPLNLYDLSSSFELRSTATRSWASARMMNEDLRVVQERLRWLINSWNTLNESGIIDRTVTLTSE